MITITGNLSIDEDEIGVRFIRSPGPGGQHVNKVESAVQIRFDAKNCASINEEVFARLKKLSGQRMTMEGIIILTANGTRSQVRNKEDAIKRLVELLKSATKIPKKRKKTKPTYSSKVRRIEGKVRKGNIKKLRSRNSIE